MERKTKKLLVYSHDTYGLGNIRRTLAICNYLIDAIPDLSIFVISGSPMIHGLKIPRGIDYVKLPCLNRTEREGYSVKFLGTEMNETMRLRSELILSTVVGFNPDLLLVDKKPFGVKNELKEALDYMKVHLPDSKLVLLLRDILDKPEVTIKVWEKNHYYEAIELLYDLVLVVGLPEVFDVRNEYRFPATVSEKVRYCGYIQREVGYKKRNEIREELGLRDEKLVLVTPGGGQDGYRLLQTYVSGMDLMPREGIKSLVICGPEMPFDRRASLYEAMAKYPNLKVSEFTNDMMGYMDAADLVISMGGYNTICEILSLKKPAIVIPRVRPVEEQWIRAERMAQLGLFRNIHPDDLTPRELINAVIDEFEQGKHPLLFPYEIDLQALPRMANVISELLNERPSGLNQTQTVKGPHLRRQQSSINIS